MCILLATKRFICQDNITFVWIVLVLPMLFHLLTVSSKHSRKEKILFERFEDSTGLFKPNLIFSLYLNFTIMKSNSQTPTSVWNKKSRLNECGYHTLLVLLRVRRLSILLIRVETFELIYNITETELEVLIHFAYLWEVELEKFYN